MADCVIQYWFFHGPANIAQVFPTPGEVSMHEYLLAGKFVSPKTRFSFCKEALIARVRAEILSAIWHFFHVSALNVKPMLSLSALRETQMNPC